MDNKERKWKDRIAEGIILYGQQDILKKTGNPYATLADPKPQIEQRNLMAEAIYKHLVTMGMIK